MNNEYENAEKVTTTNDTNALTSQEDESIAITHMTNGYTTSTTEELLLSFRQQQITIIPAIQELERWVKFINERFNLNLPSDLIITIEDTHPRTKGFYRSPSCSKIWKIGDKPIHSIVISSEWLKGSEFDKEDKLEPFQITTHEVAHYSNNIEGIQDCSRNGKYHNKKFKDKAEMLLLNVEKTKSIGFAVTTLSDELRNIIANEFKANTDAFKVFQELDNSERKKKKSRMIKYSCGCSIIYSARTNSDGESLSAQCKNCGNDFEIEEGSDDD